MRPLINEIELDLELAFSSYASFSGSAVLELSSSSSCFGSLSVEPSEVTKAVRETSTSGEIDETALESSPLSQLMCADRGD